MNLVEQAPVVCMWACAQPAQCDIISTIRSGAHIPVLVRSVAYITTAKDAGTPAGKAMA